MGRRHRELEDLDADELRPFSAAWLFHWHDRLAQKQWGRLLLFLFFGWLGTILATVAVEFDEWQDLVLWDESNYWNLERVLDPAVFLFWPLRSMLTPPWSVLHLFLFLGLAVAAFIYLSEPWPSPIWLIGFATYGSVVPLISDDTAIPAFVLLGIFWIGIGGLGWYALQFYHHDFVEKVRCRLTGQPVPEPDPDPGPETDSANDK